MRTTVVSNGPFSRVSTQLKATLSVYSYSKYRDALNFDGIDFPVQVKQIPKFEAQNSDISVNVVLIVPYRQLRN